MAKKNERVRVLALCVFRRGDMIFVAEGYDSTTTGAYYRPIGGGVEFGEPAAQTVVREIMEEIEAPVSDVRYLGMLENIFVYENEARHEICLMFDGRFEEDFRNADDYTATGTDGERHLFDAMWKSLDFFRAEDAPSLYPDGLLDLLDQMDERDNSRS